MFKGRMKYLSALFTAAALAGPMATYAAQGDNQNNQSAAQSAGAQTAATTVSDADRKFVTKAAQDGMAEVQLGQLAQEKGQSDQVKQFGARMVQDHTQANDQLKSIAQAKGIALPAAVEGKHRKHLEKMQNLSGAEFDRAYMKHMVDDHQKAVKLFKREAERGSDADLKAFAASTLPKLQDHLAMAKSTEKAARAQAKDAGSAARETTTPATSQ
jgi:putative membrane protein